MVNGVVVGIVVDNVDPDRLGRIKVQYPVEHQDRPETSWCRMLSPMAGQQRGLVMLPDIGTEVILAFAYRTLTPYILGAVYNGAADAPAPYANEDGHDDHRRFWSRNSHWIDFDDTPGDEHVRLTSTTDGEAITQDLDAARKTITEKVKRDIQHEAVERMTFKCRDFVLEASNSIAIQAGTTGVFHAVQQGEVRSGGTQTWRAARVDVNGGAPAQPQPPPALPPHSHPPSATGGRHSGG